MEIFLYAVFGLATTWAMYAIYMQLATRSAEGRPADPLYAEFAALRDSPGRALVYCTSPRCGPCKPMSREVDNLKAEGLPVFTLDITVSPDLARQIGVRATPTLIVVEKGAVARMVLGAKTASYMRDLLNG